MFFKRFLQNIQGRVYLDFASSTPVDFRMLRGVPTIPAEYSGANPSALHKEGVGLRKVLTNARAVAATAIGAHTDEIIFTSNATESDNIALHGYVRAAITRGVPASSIALYTSPFEHAAVLETASQIHPDLRVCSLVQESGYVVPKAITIPDDVAVVLISVLYIQNEIGAVQPIREIAKQIRALRKNYPDKEILFHVDATQAPLTHDLHVLRLGVDMLTLGATKLYCHKGVGLLFKRRGVTIAPLLFGGGQEQGIRPGTEAVALIHEFAYALSYAQSRREQTHRRFSVLQSFFEKKLKEKIPQVRIFSEGDRASHITHIGVPDFDSELLVLELDARGIAVSAKSACKNEEDEQSAVLSLLYPGQTIGAIRVSFGRRTTKKDLLRCVRALVSVMKKYNR